MANEAPLLSDAQLEAIIQDNKRYPEFIFPAGRRQESEVSSVLAELLVLGSSTPRSQIDQKEK